MGTLKYRALALSAVILFLFLLAGCKIKNPLTSGIKPLEGNIYFSIRAEIPSSQVGGSRTTMLRMRTEKIYGCFNYQIATKVSRSRDEILVFVSHVFIKGACFLALGPARCEVPLDVSDGTYSLVISNRDFDDRYELTIEGPSTLIVVRESHFTKLD